MHRRTQWIACALVALLALMAGCGDTADSSGDSSELVLRTYAVPDELDRDELYFTLNNVLEEGNIKQGQVTAGPAGTLIITAPHSVHRGIEELLDELRSRGPIAEPVLGSVSVNYWILLGRPTGAGATGSAIRVAPGQQGRLEHLQPVLDQIAAVQGPLEYHLLEQLQLTSVVGNQRSELRGRRVYVTQHVVDDRSADRLADISISMSGNRGVLHSLESRVRLESGKFIVLGQTAYNGKNGPTPSGWDPTDDLMLYYVIALQSD